MARTPAGAYRRKDGRYEKRIVINGKRYSVYGKTSKELTEKELELREQIWDGLYSYYSQPFYEKAYKVFFFPL